MVYRGNSLLSNIIRQLIAHNDNDDNKQKTMPLIGIGFEYCIIGFVIENSFPIGMDLAID